MWVKNMSTNLLKKPLYTTQTLQESGYSFRMIQQLIANDEIVRVKRGLYVPSFRLKEKHECAFSLFPNALFCLQSAAYVYGYLYKQPNLIYIAANKNESRIKYDSDVLPLKTMYRDLKYYYIGYSSTLYNGVKISITDRERTVLDCIRHRNLIGINTYQQVIQNYILDPQKDVFKLIIYAKKMRMIRKVAYIFEPWIENFSKRIEQVLDEYDKIEWVIHHEA